MSDAGGARDEAGRSKLLRKVCHDDLSHDHPAPVDLAHLILFGTCPKARWPGVLKVEARRARDIITAEAVKAAVSPGRTQTSKAPLRLPYPPEPTPSFTVC